MQLTATPNGLKPRSIHPGGYCKARQHLPLEMIRSLVRETGEPIASQAPKKALGEPYVSR